MVNKSENNHIYGSQIPEYEAPAWGCARDAWLCKAGRWITEQGEDFGRQSRILVSCLHFKATLNSWEGFRKELQEQSRTGRAAICQGTSGTQQTELVCADPGSTSRATRGASLCGAENSSWHKVLEGKIQTRNKVHTIWGEIICWRDKPGEWQFCLSRGL